ncbi:hypothetical protein A2T55_10995 [Brevibacterium linens]|uniref:Uncharacterized protein n=1 Tax=Brevibacterium linens TaxID=1703 RepID=A0A142NPH4_BRELN|nr:hypothetical protein [Brevibacterium linens]AMT94239.1 hypothetical protein A2T55_10995 [Brevibacterium linens]
MTKTIDALKAELARAGEVAIGFNRTKQFLSNPTGFLGLRRPVLPAAQVIVSDYGLWAAVDGFPEGGVPWSRILEVHIAKVNVSSYVDVSIRTPDTPDRRRTLRLPHMLTVDPETLAKWIVMELMERGNPI